MDGFWPLISTFKTLCAAAFACFCAGGLYGWSALIAPLQTSFDATTAETGLVFSLAIVSFTIAVIVVPRSLAPSPTGTGLVWFALIGAACLGGAMQAGRFETFLIWFSGGFGAMSGAIYITALGIAAGHRAHKVATPVMVAAFGIGGAFFGPVWRILVANGWGLNGLLVLVAGLILAACFIAILPSSPHIPAASNPSPPASVHSGPGPSLALIWLAFAFGSFGGLMVLGLAAKILDVAQSGVALASLAMAGIAIGNTSGRLSVAWLARQFRLDHCLFLAMGLTIAGLLLAIMGGTPWVLAIGLIMVAAGYGVVASTIPVLTRTGFGATAFPATFAIVFTAWGVAGLAAPWAGGALFDRSGSFTAPLIIAVASALICGALSWHIGTRIRRIAPS